MEKIFVGTDISKKTLDYSILDGAHQVVDKHGCFLNDKKEINEFISYLNDFDQKDILVTMEHTGHYGALLIDLLSKNGIKFCLINPLEIKRSLGITRGKTDAIDAYRIASYSVKNSYKLKTYDLPSVTLQKLKVAMAQRDLYTKILVQCKNNLKSLQVAQKSLPVSNLIKEAKLAIKQNEKRIAKIELIMKELIEGEKSLINTYNKIVKVIGVGPITATKCIIETGNFTKFIDARKFNCHCGLAPFKYESGTSVRGKSRTSNLSDKSLKSVLFKAAATAINHDQQLKSYYHRKLKEGKHKLSALNAVANKIVLRIFAVAKREEPFVRMTF